MNSLGAAKLTPYIIFTSLLTYNHTQLYTSTHTLYHTTDTPTRTQPSTPIYRQSLAYFYYYLLILCMYCVVIINIFIFIIITPPPPLPRLLKNSVWACLAKLSRCLFPRKIIRECQTYSFIYCCKCICTKLMLLNCLLFAE